MRWKAGSKKTDRHGGEGKHRRASNIEERQHLDISWHSCSHAARIKDFDASGFFAA